MSICVNMIIVQVISIEAPKEVFIEVPAIKLNLKAASKKVVKPVTKQQNIELPIKAASKRIVTETRAKKTVSAVIAEPRDVLPVAKPRAQAINQNVKLSVNQFNPSFENAAPVKPLESLVAKVERTAETQNQQAPPQGVVNTAVPRQENGKSASSVIHKANYRRQTAPRYPQRAFELGQEGTVTLHAEVMANGLPRQLKIMKSSGHRLLDTAAVAAVKKWEFEPTNVNGNAIVSWVKVPVNFLIKQ